MLPPLQTNLSHITMMPWHGERQETGTTRNQIFSLLKLLSRASKIHAGTPTSAMPDYLLWCGPTCCDVALWFCSSVEASPIPFFQYSLCTCCDPGQRQATCTSCLWGAPSCSAFARDTVTGASAWDVLHSTFSLGKSCPYLKGQLGSIFFLIFPLLHHSESESFFFQCSYSMVLLWRGNKTAFCHHLSPAFLFSTSPQHIGPTLP